VSQLPQSFNWTDIIDLGVSVPRAVVILIMPIWLRLFGALQKLIFNFRIVR
jgi:hypothetical protein